MGYGQRIVLYLGLFEIDLGLFEMLGFLSCCSRSSPGLACGVLFFVSRAFQVRIPRAIARCEVGASGIVPCVSTSKKCVKWDIASRDVTD